MTDRNELVMRQQMIELATLWHQRDLELRQAFAELVELVGEHMNEIEAQSPGIRFGPSPGDRVRGLGARVFPGDRVEDQADVASPPWRHVDDSAGPRPGSAFPPAGDQPTPKPYDRGGHLPTPPRWTPPPWERDK